MSSELGVHRCWRGCVQWGLWQGVLWPLPSWPMSPRRGSVGA